MREYGSGVQYFRYTPPSPDRGGEYGYFEKMPDDCIKPDRYKFDMEQDSENPATGYLREGAAVNE